MLYTVKSEEVDGTIGTKVVNSFGFQTAFGKNHTQWVVTCKAQSAAFSKVSFLCCNPHPMHHNIIRFQNQWCFTLQKQLVTLLGTLITMIIRSRNRISTLQKSLRGCDYLTQPGGKMGCNEFIPSSWYLVSFGFGYWLVGSYGSDLVCDMVS